MQGKLKLKSVNKKDIFEGMQVVFRNSVAIVGKRFTDAYSDKKLNIDYKPSFSVSNAWLSPEMEKELKILVVEYDDKTQKIATQNTGEPCYIKLQIPLDFSQWHSCLFEGKVNTIVDFKIKESNDIDDMQDAIFTSAELPTYAKVILNKKQIGEITAGKRFNKFFKSFPRYGVSLASEWETEIIKIANKLANDKAKFHVKEALKAASKKAEIDVVNVSSDEFQMVVNKNTILNAYPLDKIK